MKLLQKKRIIYITVAIAVLALLIIIGVGASITTNVQNADDNSFSDMSENEDAENILPIYTEDEVDLGISLEDVENNVAWLEITNTDIDHPVMQSGDNDYYLSRNEVGEYSVWGCFFADYFSNLQSKETLNQNTVIYGHSGNDENPNGNRFGQLYRYVDQEFLEGNPYIYLTIGEEQLTFEVFGVFYTDTSFYYIDPTPSEQGFDLFMETVNRNNLHNIGIEVTEQDKLLTLSTCSQRYDVDKTGNHRFVVMAKLV